MFEVDPLGEISALPEDTPLPDGAYTTFRTYHGNRVLRLDKHIERLRESVRLQGHEAVLEFARARRAVAQVLTTARLPEARIRLVFAPPRLFVVASEFTPLPAGAYTGGVACISVPVRRENPLAKDTRFLRTISGVYEGLPPGVNEGLMVDPADGAVLEGLTSNFFGSVAGELRTEPERALAGVTRSLVLELAGGFMPVRLEPVRSSDRPRLSEAFLSSVSRGVLPVTRIDGAPVCDGRPGPVTRHLMRQLAELAERDARPVE